MLNQLFDFSKVKVGDKLTRVIYNLWINEASVVELTEQTIKCLVLVDCPRMMTFDRFTGVNVQGSRFGLLVNMACGQGREFIKILQADLHQSIEKEGGVPELTRDAIKEQLSHTW